MESSVPRSSTTIDIGSDGTGVDGEEFVADEVPDAIKVGGMPQESHHQHHHEAEQDTEGEHHASLDTDQGISAAQEDKGIKKGSRRKGCECFHIKIPISLFLDVETRCRDFYFL